jgi:signal transduction histidine kinase
MNDPLAKIPVKYKLTLTFIFICLLSLGVGGMMGFITTKRSLENQILEDLSLIAEGLKGSIYFYLENLKNRTQDFSSDGYIRDMTSGLLQKNDQVNSAELSHHLRKNKVNLVKSFFETLVVNPQGRVLASSYPANIGEDLSEERYFQRGTVEIYLGEIGYLARDEEQPCFPISAPLTDKVTGEFIGVLINRVDPQELADVVRGVYNISFGGISRTFSDNKTLNSYLVRSDGYVITSTRDAGFKEVFLKKLISTLPIKSFLKSREGQYKGIYQDYRGDEVVGVAIPLQNMQWVLVVEIPTRDAFKPIGQLKRNLLWGGIILIGFTIGLLYFPMRFTIFPLLRLKNAVDKIEDGEFPDSLGIDSRDEIGQLARSFDHMARKLAERTEKLEQSYKDLKEREHEVEQEKNLLTTIIHCMNDGIVFVDGYNKILFTNDATVLVQRAQRHIGESILYWNPSDIHISISRMIEKARKERRVQTHSPIQLEGKFYESIFSPVIDPRGDYLGTIWVSRDITERKIIEQQMIQSEKLSSIGQLSAGIAHELNTPLGSIVFLADELSDLLSNGQEFDGSIKKRIVKILESIQEQAYRCKDITQSLLNFSRKSDIIEEDSDVIEIIDEIISLVSSSQVKYKTNIIKQYDNLGLFIKADPALLRQVFLNLFTNALDAIVNQGEITVQARKEKDDIHVCIIDNGIGIPEESLKKVFDPFFTTKPPDKGTGLGLSLSYGIIKDLGGDIKIDSQLGRGTRVEIILPVLKAIEISP